MDSIDDDMGDDMKLMIDIDEAKYETFLNGMYSGMTDADLFSAIKNGTPIPDNAKQDEAISTLKNTAWLGTEDDRAKVDEAIKILQSKQIPQCGDREYTLDEEYQAYDMAISALERQADIEVIRDGNDPTVSNFQNILNSQINNSMNGEDMYKPKDDRSIAFPDEKIDALIDKMYKHVYQSFSKKESGVDKE